MKNVLGLLKTAVFTLDMRGIINILSVTFNPFSTKRVRPPDSKYIRYTNDILKGKDFEIGDYTYGMPSVSHFPGRKLKIGKFCAISWGVSIETRGNHRIDFVTTYPFIVFADHWPAAKSLREEDVGAVSRGDVIIGNDVWIGFGAM